jgi:hypothetical protein
LRHHRKEVYTNCNEATSATPAQPYAMLEHLINGEFHPEVVDATTEVLSFEKADASTTIDAKVKTAEWLKDLELDDEEAESKADKKLPVNLLPHS